MSISLRIFVVRSNNIKTMQFDGSMRAYDVCLDIKEKLGEDDSLDHGLFWPDEDVRKGKWLEPGRTLDYYDLKSGDLLEYKKKHRPLRVKMMDGALKTVLVDDSMNVESLLKTVCEKIGITNTEEFSFVVEEVEAEETESSKDMSRKGSAPKPRDDKKMSEMRKKLHTDDSAGWLNHDKSLREQGVDETQILLLKKKFFFSDRNVDRNDPVQLNLLYVQSRDAILSGAHKVTIDEASQFAAMQCQVQYGDHEPDKHKPGFLELKEFLPPEYLKDKKTIEKKIFQEHRKLTGMSGLNAKYRYIQLCRSLKTYGVTFFLVKEKLSGKNKLVPRLLGITRDCIMAVDERTKEAVKTWPLTTVRRWAASPNSFTLDFGDYSESYYSVQTSEGEAISRLVAGYIDIIIQKKKDSDRGVPDDAEGSIMVEDNIAAVRATGVHRLPSNLGYAQEVGVAYPGVVRPGMPGYAGSGNVGPQALQYSQVGPQGHGAGSKVDDGLMEAQRALASNITNGFAAVSSVTNELGTAATLPPLGNDPASIQWRQQTMDVNKQNVTSQLAAMTAATASVLTLTSGDPKDINYTAVGSSVTTISSNLSQLAQGTKMMSALITDKAKADRLLEAARTLALSTQRLLKAVPQPGQQVSRNDLLQAASTIGMSSTQMLASMGDTEVGASSQEEIIALAKAVVDATGKLVSDSKVAASKCADPGNQVKVINAAKGTAMSTQELVACTKVVAPCLNSPLCQDQLIEAANIVSERIKTLQSHSQEGCQDESAILALNTSASDVSSALAALVALIKKGGRENKLDDYDQSVETILSTTDELVCCMGNASEMVRHAKILATATSQLVNCIKGEASKETYPEIQQRLLTSARLLAEKTAHMVQAAKTAARTPNDPEAQAALKFAATELRNATNDAAAGAVQKKLLCKLEETAKQAAACSTQLISAAQGASASNRNAASQQQLLSQSKAVADQVGRVVGAVRDYHADPNNAANQLNLITLSRGLLQPSSKLIAASKAAIPTVGDAGASLQLANNAKATAQALAELKQATAMAQDSCGNLEIDAAIGMVKNIDSDLRQALDGVANDSLLPLPGETAESSAMELGATSKTVGSSMAQLLTAANQGNQNYTSIAARDTANALKILGGAVRGVAATTKDRETQEKILNTARKVMEESSNLIREAKSAASQKSTPETQQRLQQVAKAVSSALNEVVNCLPGQRDVDSAIKAISLCAAKLTPQQLPPLPTSSNYNDLQSDLNASGTQLNSSSARLLEAARGTPEQLAAGAKAYEDAFQRFMDNGMLLAAATKDPKAKQDLLDHLKQVSAASAKILLAAKAINADPSTPNAKQHLQGSHSTLTAAVSNLLNLSSNAAPGHRECDAAFSLVQNSSVSLDNPDTPVNDLSYFQCLNKVMSDSGALSSYMNAIRTAAADNDVDKISEAIANVAKTAASLSDSTAQAAYVVGASDPSSVAGVQGLIDQDSFARSAQSISDACDALLDPSNTQQQILSSATVIAKHTSALCSSCKAAAQKTNNPVARQHFNTNAKNLATTTAALVKSIKQLAVQPNEENRQACAETTKPLVEAVNALVSYASSPEFASVPADISTQAREHQKPLIAGGKRMADSILHLINTSKQVISDPGDQAQIQMLQTNSKAVSDSIRKLVVAIQSVSPGSRDIDVGIEKITAAVNDVDQASLNSMLNQFPPNHSNTVSGFQDQVMGALQELQDGALPLIESAKGSPEKLGHTVDRVAKQFAPLITGAMGAASRMQDKDKQANMLERTKTVCESALALLYASKTAGGDVNAAQAQKEVDETGSDFLEAVSDLIATIEGAAGEVNAINNVVASVQKAMAVLESSESVDTGISSYQDYQARITTSAKVMVQRLADVSRVSKGSPEELAKATRELGKTFENILSDSKAAIQLTTPDQKAALKGAVESLGVSSVGFLDGVRRVQENPRDVEAIKNMTVATKQVTDNIAGVLGTVQEGSKGIKQCDLSVEAIGNLSADLEAATMFASMGQLTSDDRNDNFSQHKESILSAAKAMVNDTKVLVAGAAGTQEALATAAASALDTTTKLGMACKKGAQSIGSADKDAQELLLNSARSVAFAMTELIDSTKKASGKQHTDPSMEMLKDNAKGMVQTISTLLKTVKSVDDESARGARALEGAMEAIKAETKTLDSSEPPKKASTSENVIRCAQDVTKAMQLVVAASNMTGKQDVLTAAANSARKAVVDLVQNGRAASHDASDTDVMLKTQAVIRAAADGSHDLLSSALNNVQKTTPETKKELLVMSKKIADHLNDVVSAARSLKGDDFVDPNDPNVIAENELLAAASAIEAAAKKLAELKPREVTRKADENMTFDELILESAKAIAAATSALVRSATATQRELVATGAVNSDVGSHSYAADSEFRDGLVSAAKHVAGATGSLCDCANDAVQGNASEEKLVAAARAVSSSTTSLLIAASVKTDVNSKSSARLQAAGRAVKKSTDSLVKAASKSEAVVEEENLIVEGSTHRTFAQELEMQESVLKAEAELAKARKKLEAMRKGKYSKS